MGYYPTSADADTAILRIIAKNGGRDKEDGRKQTLDKISLTI